ncbi:MAG: ompC [Rhodocyclaceae bacterium]|nr:ompC [Rhodocyclaceae bacterium]
MELTITPRRRLLSVAIGSLFATTAWAQVPAGPIDPVTANVPKYVIPLVIPPEMPKSGNTTEPCPSGATCPTTTYNIALRQFRQQILPGGIWNALNGRSDGFGATQVWSYGSASDPIPMGLTAANGTVLQPPGVAPVPASQSSFNYPAFTVEARSQTAASVRWINELVALNPITGKPYSFTDKRRTALPHLLAIDRTLHFANPERLPCTNPATGAKMLGAPDCTPYVDPANPDPRLGQPYDGPVPMVVHVHGAEVASNSDGFPQAWWLPSGFSQTTGNALTLNYAVRGTNYDQAPSLRSNQYPGSAAFLYGNAQPATTLWFHDHVLGMTANNVYTGPAGFWLIRGDYTAPNGSQVKEAPVLGVLPGSSSPFGRPTNPKLTYQGQPGCDPNFDAACRARIREIPIALQDRSFNADGSLFYPRTRAFFDGGNTVPYLPSPTSDISPIHNPEVFGNMIVVNGAVWPTFEVVGQRYRLRLLAGADSRTFNLSLWAIPPGATPPNQNSPTYIQDLKAIPGVQEIPFYQIGAEQGFLPRVVKVKTGTAVPLPGNGTEPTATCTPADPSDIRCQIALLMGPAERADVIVDFTGLPPGTKVRMINTGPDVPFNNTLAPADLANPAGTGQVMEFKVVAANANTPPETSTAPANLRLSSEPANAAPVKATRRASLIETDSKKLCVTVDAAGTITVVGQFATPQADIAAACAAIDRAAIPFGPAQAFIGTLVGGVPQPQPWDAPITQAPTVGDTEVFEIYNYTVDAHPIHLHGARVQVVNRETLVLDPATGLPVIPAATTGAVQPPRPTETGYKDSVFALPGSVTRIKAKFEIASIYVWHCHIVEHEDNEMMVPYCVKGSAAETACTTSFGRKPWPIVNGGAGLAY